MKAEMKIIDMGRILPASAKIELDSLALMQSLDSSIQLLAKVRMSLDPDGSMAIWRVLNHAAQHLETQLERLLAE
jgi:hypothetical protein